MSRVWTPERHALVASLYPACSISEIASRFGYARATVALSLKGSGVPLLSFGWRAERSRRTPPMYRMPGFTTWQSMKARCTDPTHHSYQRYGGRGITVCAEWLASFWAFYEDMGPRPSPRHSIDRINNDSGYTKENCRWATKREQSNNKWNNRLITLLGVTHTATKSAHTWHQPIYTRESAQAWGSRRSGARYPS